MRIVPWSARLSIHLASVGSGASQADLHAARRDHNGTAAQIVNCNISILPTIPVLTKPLATPVLPTFWGQPEDGSFGCQRRPREGGRRPSHARRAEIPCWC